MDAAPDSWARSAARNGPGRPAYERDEPRLRRDAFIASAPHSLDAISVRRLAGAVGWLERVARESPESPFTVEDLELGRVPLLVHPHVVPDAHLIAAVVARYVGPALEDAGLPGFVVVLTGLRRRDGFAVRRAVEELAGLLPLLRVSPAGPGLPDFVSIGARPCPTTLVAISAG